MLNKGTLVVIVKELDLTCTGNYRSVLGDKYEANSTKSGYTQYMKLSIKNVGPKDFGSYKCVAQNSLGSTDGVIKLDGKSSSIIIIVSKNHQSPFKRFK